MRNNDLLLSPVNAEREHVSPENDEEDVLGVLAGMRAEAIASESGSEEELAGIGEQDAQATSPEAANTNEAVVHENDNGSFKAMVPIGVDLEDGASEKMVAPAEGKNHVGEELSSKGG